jgi:hypothetical protein
MATMKARESAGAAQAAPAVRIKIAARVVRPLVFIHLSNTQRAGGVEHQKLVVVR